jgi:hypothetical protein
MSIPINTDNSVQLSYSSFPFTISDIDNYATSNHVSNISNILRTAINTKQDTLTAATNLLGVGTSITAIDYTKVSVNKPTNFQSDWTSTIINKPTIYTQSETNTLLNAKQNTLTAATTLLGTGGSITGINYNTVINKPSYTLPLSSNATTNNISIDLSTYYIKTETNTLIANTSNYASNISNVIIQNTSNYASNISNILVNNINTKQNTLTAATTLLGTGGSITGINYNTVINKPSYTLPLSSNATTNNISIDLSTYYIKTETNTLIANTSNYASNISNVLLINTSNYASNISNILTTRDATNLINTSNYASNISNVLLINYNSLNTITNTNISNYASNISNVLTIRDATNLINTSNYASNISNVLLINYNSLNTTTNTNISNYASNISNVLLINYNSLNTTTNTNTSNYASNISNVLTVRDATNLLNTSNYASNISNIIITRHLPLTGGVVSGLLRVNNEFQIGDATYQLLLQKPSATEAAYIQTIQQGVGYNQNLTLQAIAGNVGIGTSTNITEKLVVNGNIKTSGSINIQTVNTVLDMGARSQDNIIRLWYNGTDTYGFGINSYTLRYNVPTNSSHRFYTGTTNTVTIDGSGNVGIGTNDPSIYKLSVNGILKMSSFDIFNPDGRITHFQFGNSGNNYIRGRLVMDSVSDTATIAGNVGIGGASTNYKLEVYGSVFVRGSIGIQSDDLNIYRSGGGIGGNINAGGNITCLLYAITNSGTDYVGVGNATSGNNQNYLRQLYIMFDTFTGFHRCFTNDELFDNENPQSFKDTYIGRIVVSTGKIATDFKSIDNDEWEIKYDKEGITIEDALPMIEISRKKKDKRVFGVLGNSKRNNSRSERLIINSVGEGGIWVCNSNGNIENGDYITSSDYLGYGEKQEDDLLHNFTVAKATIDCDFELNNNLYNCIELNESNLRIAFIACTYHCG